MFDNSRNSQMFLANIGRIADSLEIISDKVATEVVAPADLEIAIVALDKIAQPTHEKMCSEAHRRMFIARRALANLGRECYDHSLLDLEGEESI